MKLHIGAFGQVLTYLARYETSIVDTIVDDEKVLQCGDVFPVSRAYSVIGNSRRHRHTDCSAECLRGNKVILYS